MLRPSPYCRSPRPSLARKAAMTLCRLPLSWAAIFDDHRTGHPSVSAGQSRTGRRAPHSGRCLIWPGAIGTDARGRAELRSHLEPRARRSCARSAGPNQAAARPMRSSRGGRVARPKGVTRKSPRPQACSASGRMRCAAAPELSTADDRRGGAGLLVSRGAATEPARSRDPKRGLGKGAGGDGGIRTLDRALQPYNGLANRRLQPLGHISEGQRGFSMPHCSAQGKAGEHRPGRFRRAATGGSPLTQRSARVRGRRRPTPVSTDFAMDPASRMGRARIVRASPRRRNVHAAADPAWESPRKTARGQINLG
jgi:hypothetical protein